MNAEPGFDAAAQRELEQLLPLVFEATGIDFSSYKEDTLLRRLEKRKATLGIATADEYLRLARRSPDELHTLQQMFLVSVSSFFRDQASFRVLERAFAALLADKAACEPIAVWVPGCASGDEAYSLAIVLSELLGPEPRRHPVQVVGTDLNPEALAVARAGLYRHTALAEMDPALLARHFRPRGQHHEVAPSLRALVRFEQRDVLAGAPVTPLDLVSCRNLLIYMKGPLQDRLIECCHHALRPRGLLFIGPSESLGAAGDALFSPVDYYHRVFRRRD
jgi:chemotaxis protein methyltransferase CheR/two-component system CheB/CheR fusion protein